MPTITKKQLEDYEQLCRDRNNGRLLTPDGLRLICEALSLWQHYSKPPIYTLPCLSPKKH